MKLTKSIYRPFAQRFGKCPIHVTFKQYLTTEGLKWALKCLDHKLEMDRLNHNTATLYMQFYKWKNYACLLSGNFSLFSWWKNGNLCYLHPQGYKKAPSEISSDLTLNMQKRLAKALACMWVDLLHWNILKRGYMCLYSEFQLDAGFFCMIIQLINIIHQTSVTWFVLDACPL